jgi:hypothetical protein
MVDPAHMRQLASSISGAAARGEWVAVSAHDATIAATVGHVGAPATWSAAEQAALRALRDAHGEALRLCGQAALGLATRLAAMPTQREGLIAYASNNDNDNDQEGSPS